MSATTDAAAEIADGGDRRCQAPSCWATASVVDIEGDDVADPPVLCEIHRRAYLGVST